MSATASVGRRVEDWRRTPERQLIPLMVAEADRWRIAFDWDVTPAWRAIAAARTAGALPGLLAFDDAGQPSAPESVNQGLAFPDGIGVAVLADPVAPDDDACPVPVRGPKERCPGARS